VFPALAPTAVPDCKSLAAAPVRPFLVKAAFAAVFVEVLELTCAPELPVETEVLFETAALLCGAEVCARAVPTIRLPKTNEARMTFIAIILRRGRGVHPGPNGSCATRKPRSRLTRCMSCCASSKCTADAKPLICCFLNGLNSYAKPAILANGENYSAGRADKKSGY